MTTKTDLNNHAEILKNSNSSFDPNGFLTKKAVCAFLGGVGKSTINDWIKRKDFPRPLAISQTLKLWRKQDIIRWVETHTTDTHDKQSPLMGGMQS